MSDVKLLEVKPGRRLCWPFASQSHPLRGLGGTVVPEDDPLINCADENGMLIDQRHHLRAARPGAVVTPHSNIKAKAVYEELGYDRVPYMKSPEAARQRAAPPKPTSKAAELPKANDPRVALTEDDLDVPKPLTSAAAEVRVEAPPAPPKGGGSGSAKDKGK